MKRAEQAEKKIKKVETKKRSRQADKQKYDPRNFEKVNGSYKLEDDED